MNDLALVQCPYCFESVELFVDPDTRGELVEDCYVCCRPWRITVSRDHDGGLQVSVDRAQ